MNQNKNQNGEANTESNSYIEQVEEYTGKPVNILNKLQINYAISNIDDEEQIDKFLDIIKSLDYVKVKYVGQETFNDEDTDLHNTYEIMIKRGNNKVRLTKYKTSIVYTESNIQPTLYDILTMIASDGMIEASTFEDYCEELGFDEDSITNLRQYKFLVREQNKIFKIFTREELGVFPQ